MMAKSGYLRLGDKHSRQDSEPLNSIPRLKHHLSNKSGQVLACIAWASRLMATHPFKVSALA